MADSGITETLELPIFPLESVLMPLEQLPLRIFEPRYVALVDDCVRSKVLRFGVVLISRGREVGGGDERYEVGALAEIADYVNLGEERYALHCLMGERIKVCDWLPDQPYPRATVRLWPDEPGEPVTGSQLQEIDDRVMALFERVAAARDARPPRREEVLGRQRPGDIGKRLYALASQLPLGPADRYAVLSAPSPAARLAALNEAVDSVAAMIEFQLSE
ncbi:MAG: LON peptidase substrate-binding domain-containing protein [Mycobacterium sp.]|uniref:LON peptidase substrate-binding domain-containing protein n=1 Tax=Mycobacterium sp. TaxID=1785 RepID=UPI003CC50DC2